MNSSTCSSVVDAIDRAISVFGTQQELAKKLGDGYSQQKISYWRKVGRVPAEHAVLLERVTGVPKEILCPNVFKQEKDKIPNPLAGRPYPITRQP